MNWGGCGCLAWTHKHTNRLSSLHYDGFCQTYRTAAGTLRQPTTASPPSSSPDRSTTRWNNNTTIYCSLKRAPVMSPPLSKKLRSFKIWRIWSAHLHILGRTVGRDTGRCAFSQCGHCCCRRSLLVENNWKKTLALKNNTMWTLALTNSVRTDSNNWRLGHK